MLRSCVPKNALGLPFTITGSSGRGAISGGIAADSWAAGSSGRPKMPGQESYQRPASVRFRKGTIFVKHTGIPIGRATSSRRAIPRSAACPILALPRAKRSSTNARVMSTTTIPAFRPQPIGWPKFALRYMARSLSGMTSGTYAFWRSSFQSDIGAPPRASACPRDGIRRPPLVPARGLLIGVAGTQQRRLVERPAHELQAHRKLGGEAAGHAERREPGEIPRVGEPPAGVEHVLGLPVYLDMALRDVPGAQRQCRRRQDIDTVERSPHLVRQRAPQALGLEEVRREDELPGVHERADFGRVLRAPLGLLQVLVVPGGDGGHLGDEDRAEGRRHV